MRIVFFVSSMDGGGAERVAALLSNAWVADGHSVTLVATYSGRGGCDYALHPDVAFVYLADLVGTMRRTPWTLVRRLWWMRALVRETHADMAISFLPNVNTATVLATLGLRLPVVVSERAYPPAAPIGRVGALLRRLTYPWATQVVLQTERGREWVERRIPGARCAVIPNPSVHPLPDGQPHVDPGDHIAHGRKLLLAVGRLHPQKGFDRLLEAFAQVAATHPDWDLAILGEGPAGTQLAEQVASTGLGGRVRLVGRVGNLGAWYARADLYALSSRSEGFPNTLLEAMSYGVPVVSMACETGPSEMLTHDETGLLVDPDTGADGLAAALARLMADADARQRLGAAGQHASRAYQVDRIARRWLELHT